MTFRPISFWELGILFQLPDFFNNMKKSVDATMSLCYHELMNTYLSLLTSIKEFGYHHSDRTKTGTTSLFGRSISFNSYGSNSFPIVTTKKVHFKSVLYELLWFLRGDTNTSFLKSHGVSIWDEWADENGDLGPIYGEQWRSWETKDGSKVDQIKALVEGIKKDPWGRRHIVSSWNVGEIPSMALPPCHTLFQAVVSPSKIQGEERPYYLNLIVYQRSCDAFLGLPFNIASYALLQRMLAVVCGLTAGELTFFFGDVHIYDTHREQVDLQLSRKPKDSPILEINTKVKDIDHFGFEDFNLVGYDPHPSIPAPVSV